MPGLLGAESVQLDLQQAMLFGKVITSAIVKTRTSLDVLTSVSFANVYVSPISQDTAMGVGGIKSRDTLAYVWRMGETTDIRPDMQMVVDSVTYLIVSVKRRLDADISLNFCIYDCHLEAAT